MTSPVDDLLTRARLVHEPYGQDDIDAAEARLAARLAGTAQEPAPAAPGEPVSDERAAARNLQTLCEAVVTRTASHSLGDFITRTLPEPIGARVLGCILQLTDSEESARFWWQYAAGADDAAASYCLYLHHLALGEHGEARWWHTQTLRIQDGLTTPTDTRPAGTPTGSPDIPAAVYAALAQISTADASLPTTLRVLNALKTRGDTQPVPAALCALLEYVPAAVGYVDDDLDLPLPDPDFTDHIRALTRGPETSPPSPRPGVLPARPPASGPGICKARRPARRPM